MRTDSTHSCYMYVVVVIIIIIITFTFTADIQYCDKQLLFDRHVHASASLTYKNTDLYY